MTYSRFPILHLFLQCALLLCGMSAGCGKRLPATVEGQVTLAGQPISSGSVVFYPEAGGAAVHGDVGPDGRYQLRTGRAEGLQTGEYRVTVMYRRGKPTLDMTPAQIDALDIAPTRYRHRDKTDLRFTIESGANTIDIPLAEK